MPSDTERARRRRGPRVWSSAPAWALPLAEVLALFVVALVFGRAYLTLDPSVQPRGLEYPSAIQPYHLWRRALECGVCALWNGNVRGGLPALLELHAGVLHPMPAIASLLFGVQAGLKLTLVGALAMAGVAQWWLARVLGAGRTARLWSGAMAIVAGNLATRMEAGWVNLVLSGAACALVVAPLVGLVARGGRRWIVALGVTIGLAAVAGQGYLQIGLLALLPLAPLFAARGRRLRAARELGLAAGLAALLAAPLWVPLLPFLGAFGKEEDLVFSTSQALRYLPFHWLIDDPAFYDAKTLGGAAIMALYNNYVGWIAVLLAGVGLARAEAARDDAAMGDSEQEDRVRDAPLRDDALRDGASGDDAPGDDAPGDDALRNGASPAASDRRRAAWLLAALAVGALWIASAAPLRWGIALSPLAGLDRAFASVRNPALIAGLSVAPLLGLAAIGVDGVLHRLTHVATYSLRRDEGDVLRFRLDARWLLAPVLAWSLFGVARTTGGWLAVDTLPPQVGAELAVLETPDHTWVMPPFGEHVYIEPAMERGYKLVSDLKPWYWRDHPDPTPYLALSRTDDPPYDGVNELVGTVGNMRLFRGPDRLRYANLVAGDSLSPCAGTGVGGNVDIACPAGSTAGGHVVVREHYAPGWRATVDGTPTTVRADEGSWIRVDVAPGQAPQSITLRYRPWTPWLGVALAVAGWGVVGVWFAGDLRAGRAKRAR